MGEFSISHLLLIAVIALIFFGPSRLPALGQSIGKAIRGFKTGLSEIDAEVKPVVDNQNPTHQQIQDSSVQQGAHAAQKEKEKQQS